MTEPPYSVVSEFFYAASPAQPPPEGFCRVYWGSHGCHRPRGHEGDHLCDCCECANHPDPDPGNPNSEPSCVAGPPYYGSSTLFYGEDAKPHGPATSDVEGAPTHLRRETCRYCGKRVVLGKRGWRLDNNHPSGYDCPAAPRGYHGVIKPQKGGTP